MLLTAKEMNILSALRVGIRSPIRNKSIMDYFSTDVGGNQEFQDYRPYVSGENIRYIDWNRYAQDKSFVVRLYQKPEKPEFTVAVDLSKSVVAAGKSRELKCFAAGICFCLLNRNITVKILINKKILSYNGSGAWQRLHNVLDTLAEGRDDLFAFDFPDLQTSRNIIIVSDFIFSDGFEKFKENMNFGNRNCCLFNVSTPADRAPELKGNLNLVDSQNANHLKCMINAAAIEKYKASRSAYYANVIKYCEKMQWFYREIYAEKNLCEQILSVSSNGTLIL